MKKYFLFLMLICLKSISLHAQQVTMEEAVENMMNYILEKSENTGLSTSGEEMLAQHWTMLFKQPIDLNLADEAVLQSKLMLNPLQIQSFLQYRKGVGLLQDVHELQTIHGWSSEWIRLIKPFVYIGHQVKVFEELKKSVVHGRYTYQFRANKIMQQKQGFQNDTNGVKNFLGSRWGRAFRFGFDGGKIKFGMQGELDEGERWMFNKSQLGMDHFSAFVSVLPNKGVIKKVILGDYTLSLGQGLMIWQSFGCYKGNDVLMIKNQQKGVEPNRSMGEGIGFRGLAMEAGKGKTSFLFFLSQKKSDANLIFSDSSYQIDAYRMYQTGLHRSISELETRNRLNTQTLGYSLTQKVRSFSVSFNQIFSLTNLTAMPKTSLYDRFETKEKWQNNFGVDFNGNLAGNHFFGECILDHNGSKGLWVGMLGSLTKNISISSFYRNLDRGLMTVFSNLPLEYDNNNETGLYAGMKLTVKRISIDVFTDVFRSKWLRYGINTSSFGNEWVINSVFKSPDKTELQIRLKQENKPNPEPGWKFSGLKPWISRKKTSFRMTFTRELSESSSLKWKIEALRMDDSEYRDIKTAQLYYLEFKKICFRKKCKVNFWFCYSEIPNADLALFAFEPDPVIGASQLTSFYNSALRWGVSSTLSIHKTMKINIKYVMSINQNDAFHGVGTDRTFGFTRSEFGIGMIFKR